MDSHWFGNVAEQSPDLVADIAGRETASEAGVEVHGSVGVIAVGYRSAPTDVLTDRRPERVEQPTTASSGRKPTSSGIGRTHEHGPRIGGPEAIDGFENETVIGESCGYFDVVERC